MGTGRERQNLAFVLERLPDSREVPGLDTQRGFKSLSRGKQQFGLPHGKQAHGTANLPAKIS